MKKILLLISVVTLLFMNSCLVSKKVVYLKDMESNKSYNIAPMPPLRIQKNDRLSIEVSAKNPELAVPFNSRGGLYSLNEEGTAATTISDRGYLVDQQGNIDFPIVGTINLEGMTLDGARDFLKNMLESKNLLNSPVVKVELLNLRVLLMGETGNQIINAPDGRLTLLEALSRSGGLTNNATTDKIAVIREENGVRKMYYNNIESIEIFNSPTYYLQQNDIVYVEPKAAESRGDETRTWRIFGMFTSVISLGVTIWALAR